MLLLSSLTWNVYEQRNTHDNLHPRRSPKGFLAVVVVVILVMRASTWHYKHSMQVPAILKNTAVRTSLYTTNN